MKESENSKRVLLKSTYTPIKSKEKEPEDSLKIPFHKFNLIASIKPTTAEIQGVKSYAKTDHEDSSHKDYLKAIKTIEAVIPQFKNSNVLHNIAPFSEISTDALLNVVDDIIKLRQKESDSAIKALNHIFDAYKQQSSLSQENQQNRQEIREQIPMLLPISPSKIKFKTLMDWGIKNNIYCDEITKIMELMERITLE